MALGLWNIGRAFILWQRVEILDVLAIAPSPLLRLGMALSWCLLCGAVAVAIVRRVGWAVWAAPAVLAAYALVALGLRLAYASPPSLILILLYALPAIFSILAFSRPQARRYFDHPYRQEVAEDRIP
jgi:hypothetical protein